MFAERIDVDIHNVIRILHWDRYAGRYLTGRQNRDGEFRLWTEEDEGKRRGVNKIKAEMFKTVIAHLNKVSGKNFQIGSGESFKHFSRRFDEGATLEQFLHVVEVKCAQWIGRENMEYCVRPQTLFNSRTFWDYVAERPVREKWKAGERFVGHILEEEEKKYREEAKSEYNKRINAYMESHGYKHEDDIPMDDYYKGLPTFSEFFKDYIIKKRESPDWSLT